MAAYTGHNDKFRRLSAEQRSEFGQQHAPVYVAPPTNRCECGVQSLLLRPTWWGRICADCESRKAREEWQEVKDMAEEIDPFDCHLTPIDEWATKAARHIFDDWFWRGCPEEPMPTAGVEMVEAFFAKLHRTPHKIRWDTSNDAPSPERHRRDIEITKRHEQAWLDLCNAEKKPQEPQNDTKKASCAVHWVDERISYLKGKRTPELQKLQDDWAVARMAGMAKRLDVRVLA